MIFSLLYVFFPFVSILLLLRGIQIYSNWFAGAEGAFLFEKLTSLSPSEQEVVSQPQPTQQCLSYRLVLPGETHLEMAPVPP